jgi:hypothetical protein
MPNYFRRWTENDIAKLKAMAGKKPVAIIAAELGRTVGTTRVRAHDLGLSLRIPTSRPQSTCTTAAATAAAEDEIGVS